MRVSRSGMFEVNSSSSHAMVASETTRRIGSLRGSRRDPFSLNIKNHTAYGYDGEALISDPREKLRYLYTALSDPDYAALKKAVIETVQEHSGVNIVIPTGNNSADDEYYDFIKEAFITGGLPDHERIARFIYDTNYLLHVMYDNNVSTIDHGLVVPTKNLQLSSDACYDNLSSFMGVVVQSRDSKLAFLLQHLSYKGDADRPYLRTDTPADVINALVSEGIITHKDIMPYSTAYDIRHSSVFICELRYTVTGPDSHEHKYVFENDSARTDFIKSVRHFLDDSTCTIFGACARPTYKYVITPGVKNHPHDNSGWTCDDDDHSRKFRRKWRLVDRRGWKAAHKRFTEYEHMSRAINPPAYSDARYSPDGWAKGIFPVTCVI